MKHIILMLVLPIFCYAQKPISVDQIQQTINPDFINSCFSIDTITAEPFTGIVYLYHIFQENECDHLAYIIHYEKGLKDGAEIGFDTSQKIWIINNYHLGQKVGASFYNDYNRIVISRDSIYRKIEWDKNE